MAKASKGRRGTQKMRKSTRHGRKASRRMHKNMKHIPKSVRKHMVKLFGGAQTVFPASLDDTSMMGPSKMSLAQGGDFESIHSAQHGGAAVSLASSAPPGYTGMLDDSLRASARVIPIDQSMSGIQGMSDQSGGGRRRRKGSKKASKRGGSRMYGGRKGSKKSSKKGSRRGGMRMMYGGSPYSLANAQAFGAPGMLLSPSQEATALQGMHPEWKLATDPTSMTPDSMK